MTNRLPEQITTDVLQHEANIQTALGQSAKHLRAWQRACAFLQTQLPFLKSANVTDRDVCLRLLISCEASTVHLKDDYIQVVQHQATLQYHFVRLLHDRKDFELVFRYGMGLSKFLQQQEHQPWIQQLLQSCLTAVVAATYHEALSASEFVQCASDIHLLASGEASQLVRNLILAHMGHCRVRQLMKTEASAAYDLLIKHAASIKDADKVLARLAHFSSDAAMECLLQATSAQPFTDTSAGFFRIALLECVQRSSMFTSFVDSSTLIKIMFIAQAALPEPLGGSVAFLSDLADMLRKIPNGARNEAFVVALEVSLSSAATKVAGTTASAARLQLILQAAGVLCELTRSRSETSRLSCVTSAASAVMVSCCQQHSLMSSIEQAAVLHQGQQVMDTALQAAEGVLEAGASLQGKGSLVSSLRCATGYLTVIVAMACHRELKTCTAIACHGLFIYFRCANLGNWDPQGRKMHVKP